MAEPRLGRRKALTFRLVAIGLSLLFTLLVVEVGIRVGYLLRHARRPNQIAVDPVLGWRPTPDLQMTYEKDHFGTIHYSTDSRGSRSFGDPGTDKLRVLVLGDSFTQAVQVSDGQAYYDRLGHLRPDLELFVYGFGGSGTLQQLMVMEELAPVVRPDFVLWQFCENDFINNDAILESGSAHDNNHMRRPYLENDRIVYRHPDALLGRLGEFSYVARRATVLRGSLRLMTRGDITEHLDADDPDFLRSVRTTELLLNRVRVAAGEAPVVAFYVAELGARDYRAAAFDELCRDSGLHCIPDLGPALLAAREAGTPIDGHPEDAHWNAAGHALAAERILEFFVADGLLPASPPD